MNKLHRTLLFVLVLFSLSIGVQSAFAAETAPEPDPAAVSVPNTALALQAWMSDYHRERLGPGKMVESTAILAPNGLLTSEVHIWAYNWFSGFHGCTAVLLRNQYNQPFYVTLVQRDWVNGTAFGNSNKMRYYSTQVPVQYAQQASSIEVVIEECPNDVWDNIRRTVNNVTDSAERARRLFDIFS